MCGAAGAAGHEAVQSLSLVDFPVSGSTRRSLSTAATTPHGDVETLTDATTGTSTFRGTAYGRPDKTGTTGDDATAGIADPDADIVSPNRFYSARSDGPTGTYDMGFREYNLGLNRFLTRDMFKGALSR